MAESGKRQVLQGSSTDLDLEASILFVGSDPCTGRAAANDGRLVGPKIFKVGLALFHGLMVSSVSPLALVSQML